MTHGYGHMRDSGHEIENVLRALEYPMTAAFAEMPNSRKNEENQPIDYLAFVQCESEEFIRDLYPVSSTGVFCLDQPEANVQPSGQTYTTRPPFPAFEYHGNQVFQIKRTFTDKTVLSVSPKPQLNMVQQLMNTIASFGDDPPATIDAEREINSGFDEHSAWFGDDRLPTTDDNSEEGLITAEDLPSTVPTKLSQVLISQAAGWKSHACRENSVERRRRWVFLQTCGPFQKPRTFRHVD